MNQKQDTEKMKHPSLEPIHDKVCLDCGMTMPSSVSDAEHKSVCHPPELGLLKSTTSIASLEKQHEENLAEKQRLTELKTLLETDEADLTELRKEVLEKIRARLMK